MCQWLGPTPSNSQPLYCLISLLAQNNSIHAASASGLTQGRALSPSKASIPSSD